MLTAVPTHWYTWNFHLHDGRRVLGEIEMSNWKEKATLVVNGECCQTYREGACFGTFVLECAGKIIAKANKPSAFARKFIVRHGPRELTLEPESALRRTMVLFEQGIRIGMIAPESAFSRRALIDLPDSLLPAVRAFITWLALVLWKRGGDAVAIG